MNYLELSLSVLNCPELSKSYDWVDLAGLDWAGRDPTCGANRKEQRTIQINKKTTLCPVGVWLLDPLDNIYLHGQKFFPGRILYKCQI